MFEKLKKFHVHFSVSMQRGNVKTVKEEHAGSATSAKTELKWSWQDISGS